MLWTGVTHWKTKISSRNRILFVLFGYDPHADFNLHLKSETQIKTRHSDEKMNRIVKVKSSGICLIQVYEFNRGCYLFLFGWIPFYLIYFFFPSSSFHLVTLVFHISQRNQSGCHGIGIQFISHFSSSTLFVWLFCSLFFSPLTRFLPLDLLVCLQFKRWSAFVSREMVWCDKKLMCCLFFRYDRLTNTDSDPNYFSLMWSFSHTNRVSIVDANLACIFFNNNKKNKIVRLFWPKSMVSH